MSIHYKVNKKEQEIYLSRTFILFASKKSHRKAMLKTS